MKRLFVPCLAALLTAGFVGEALAQFDGRDFGRDRDRDNDRGRRSEVLGVVYGASDSCDTGCVVAIVNTLTNCDSLGSERSWSIKVGGQCRDISDTDARSACRGIKAEGAPNVIFGATDSCDIGKVEAIVDEDTVCDELGNNRSWSVRINGQCRDISDTDVRSACRGILAADARNVVYGSTDSCDSSKVVAVVGRRTDCSRLGGERSWSIKVDGQCRDISDTTADKACTAIKTRNAPNVVYGATDSCDESKVIAAVGLRTDCRSLPSERSWSVKINGQCRDISDTDAPRACLGVQSELVQ